MTERARSPRLEPQSGGGGAGKDEGEEEIGRELRRAAESVGVPVSINAEPEPGEICIGLGRNREGRLMMVRHAGPGEGGRTLLNYPDATLVDGRLTDRTLAWIQHWALRDLGLIRDHRERMLAAGKGPDGFHAAAMRINSLVLRVVAARGHDLATILGEANWRSSPEGYITEIEHDAFEDEAIFTRCLGEIRVRRLAINLEGGRTLLIEEDDAGGDTDMEIHGTGPLPEAVIAAATGGRLLDLIELPGRPDALIKTIENGRDGVAVAKLTCHVTMLAGEER